jgi:hypothetical protein
MTSERQKRDERARFDLFAELLTGYPMRLLSHDDTPDFLVECQGRTIGVEHTELFGRQTRSARRPHTPVQLEGIQKDIICKAMRLYLDQASPPVTVKVWFDPGMKRTKLTRGRCKTIATELSRFVAEWIRTAHTPDEWPRPGDRIPEISHLSIYGRHLAWSIENPPLVGPASVSDIQRTIDEKDTKCDAYRRKCDECWLLVAADRYNRAQAFDFSPDDSSLRHCYVSRFERLFFLELGQRWLRELSHNTPESTTKYIE